MGNTPSPSHSHPINHSEWFQNKSTAHGSAETLYFTLHIIFLYISISDNYAISPELYYALLFQIFKY